MLGRRYSPYGKYYKHRQPRLDPLLLRALGVALEGWTFNLPFSRLTWPRSLFDGSVVALRGSAGTPTATTERDAPGSDS